MTPFSGLTYAMSLGTSTVWFRAAGGHTCLTVTGNKELEMQAHPEPQVFRFDFVASEQTSQEEIFNGTPPPSPHPPASPPSKPFSP